jgi:peptidoglycan/xylan/chitin deacetylase (PgdA/CDA1 family)
VGSEKSCRAARSAILTYHSLDDTGSVISLPPAVFRDQMQALAGSGIPVVPLSEIRQRPGAVSITFDDGFANIADQALPVLERFSFPATVFVVSGYCGRYNDWPSQPPDIPRLPLLSWGSLRDFPPKISLGAHTMTHPDLRTLEDGELAREVCQSRGRIEQETGRAVDAFAYPYGAVDARSAALVEREFRTGCGTWLDFANPYSNPAILPRLDAYYLKSPWWWRDPVGAMNATYIAFRRCLRTVRKWQRGR